MAKFRWRKDLWLLKHLAMDGVAFACMASWRARKWRMATFVESWDWNRFARASATLRLMAAALSAISAVALLCSLLGWMVGNGVVVFIPGWGGGDQRAAFADVSREACARSEELLRRELLGVGVGELPRAAALPAAAPLGGWGRGVERSWSKDDLFCHEDADGYFLMLVEPRRAEGQSAPDGRAWSAPFPKDAADSMLDKAGASESEFKVMKKPTRSARLFRELAGLSRPTKASRYAWPITQAAGERPMPYDPEQGAIGGVLTAMGHHGVLTVIGILCMMSVIVAALFGMTVLSVVVAMLATLWMLSSHFFSAIKHMIFQAKNTPAHIWWRQAKIIASSECPRLARSGASGAWRWARSGFSISRKDFAVLGGGIIFVGMSMAVGLALRFVEPLERGQLAWARVSAQQCAAIAKSSSRADPASGATLRISCRKEASGYVAAATVSTQSKSKSPVLAPILALAAPGAAWKELRPQSSPAYKKAVAELAGMRPLTEASRMAAHVLGVDERAGISLALAVMFSSFYGAVVVIAASLSAWCLFVASSWSWRRALSAIREKQADVEFIARAESRELAGSARGDAAGKKRDRPSRRL